MEKLAQGNIQCLEKPDVIWSDRGFQCHITNKKQLEKLQGGEFYQRRVLFDE